jgi:hypothetical protein
MKLFPNLTLKYMSFVLHTVKPQPRLLTVSESVKGFPRIVMAGAWLMQWDFTPGDRLTAFYADAGHIFLKIDLEEAAEPKPLPVWRSRRSHPLTVSTNTTTNVPQITISGAWLRDWGFNKGSRVSVTSEGDGMIAVEVIMSAEAWRAEKSNKEAQREEARVRTVLKQYKTEYPALFDQVANPRKKFTKLKVVKPVQPSLFEQIMTATRQYNADVAARSTNPLRG